MNVFMHALRSRSQRSAFTREQRADFYRAMYLYQRAGARKLEALNKLSETYQSHLSVGQRLGNAIARFLGVRKPLFRPPIAAVADAGRLRSNLPLAEALKDWLPAAERAILAAGEDSGNLVGAFQMAGRFTRQQGGMWAQVINAFSYPLLLIAAVMGILYFIAGTVLPSMNLGSAIGFSPWVQMVLWIAQRIHDYWFIVLAATVALTVAVVGSLSRWKGSWRVKADRLPPWSIYRRVHGALFLYSYAVLQKSGVPIQTALANLASTANPWLRTRINAAMYGVRQGYDLGQSFRHAGHEFPDWEALPVLESISSLSGSSDALIEYAENWLEDTGKFVEKFTRRANAAMRVWVLVWIALLVVSVLEIITSSFK